MTRPLNNKPLHVAVLVGQFPALGETFILDQIAGLVERGCTVEIYAATDGSDQREHPSVGQYRLRERVRYAPQVPTSRILRVCKTLVLLVTHGWRAPVKLLHALVADRSLSLFFAAVPWAHQGQYDVVHAHMGHNGATAIALQALGIVRGPVLTSFYGGDVSQLQYDAAYYRRLFARGKCFLALSEVMRNRLIELGCDPARIVVHRLGMDSRQFHAAPRRWQPGEPVQMITVARLVEKKGLEYGLRAVARVVRTHPELRYTIIGRGPLRESLERLIQELGLTDRVVLAGTKTQPEIVSTLAESQIMLLPSVTAANGDQEGTPVALMEAMALGLPVLSTRHSGIPELVQDGQSGWLVAERDVAGLTERLAWMLDHPETWLALGEAGRQFVLAHHDVNRLNDRLLEILRQLPEKD